MHRLSAARHGIHARTRAADVDKKTNKQALFKGAKNFGGFDHFEGFESQYLIFANAMKKETQDESRSMIDLKSFALDWLEEPAYLSAILAAYGRKPKFGTFYNDALKYIISTDRRLLVEPYRAQFKGTSPEYAGQIIEGDGSGFNWIKYGRAPQSKTIKQYAIMLADSVSQYTFCWPEMTASEVNSWPSALLYFIEKLAFIPEMLITDRVGRLIHGLQYLKPGHASDQIHPAILLLLSGGCQPYAHVAGSPTGKANVELMVKLLKQRVNRDVMKRARSFRLDGQIEKKGFEFESERQVAQFFIEATEALNQQPVVKKDVPVSERQSRAAYFQNPTAVQRRAARALAPDLQTCVLPYVCKNSYISRLSGNTCRAIGQDGRVYTAELHSFREHGKLGSASTSKSLPQFDEIPIVLTVPKGALASDHGSTEFNAIIIEPRKGQPRFYFAEARKVALDEYHRPLDRSAPGTFVRVVDTPERRKVRQIQQIVARDAEEVERKRAAALAGKLPGEMEAAPLSASSVNDEQAARSGLRVFDDEQTARSGPYLEPERESRRTADGTFGN